MTANAVQAQILSYEVDGPDRAILTFTAGGLLCRLALGVSQVEFLDTVAPRVRHAMAAGRMKRAAEQQAAEPVTDPLPAD